MRVFQSSVTVLVLSRLDYCNTVLVGLSSNVYYRSKMLQHGSSIA